MAFEGLATAMEDSKWRLSPDKHKAELFAGLVTLRADDDGNWTVYKLDSNVRYGAVMKVDSRMATLCLAILACEKAAAEELAKTSARLAAASQEAKILIAAHLPVLP